MSDQQLASEVQELRARLAEAEQTLEAIRTGQVDAVVVRGPEGHAVYTLTGAERTYRLLVEAMNEGALVLGPDGSIIYCNHTFSAMLGLPLEQVIGSSVYDYVASADSDAVRQLLQEAIWAPGRREISLRKEGETSVPAHISVASLNVEEAAESLSAVVTDLTEHKALECELERYRQHLEELVEQRTMQLKAAVDDLKVEIDARRMAEEALAESNTELSVANEELLVINDELQAEIAERSRVENALRNMTADLNFAQAVAHTGSWRMDVRRNELLWSDETHRMFGVPKGAALTYEVFLGYVHPDDREAVDSAWQAALLQEKPYDIEHRIVVDGNVRWVQEAAELEFDDQGQLLGGFGTVQDITERKQMEQEKDDLLEREHRIAETLQQALIPSEVPSVIDGWSVGARYRPALREAQVGGDFYDVFPLGKTRFGVLIGDVAGKGLAAAIRVASIRHAVRSYAYLDLSPAEIMGLANDALCREGADERNLLTAFFAVVDTQEQSITYANAGHEPPLVRSRDGQVSEVEVTGPMLGMIADVEYQESELRLESGEEIVMFTDGITEARTGAVLFEREGVVENLTKMGDAAPDEVAEALLQAATAHAGGGLQDDVAIVVLANRGEEHG